MEGTGRLKHLPLLKPRCPSTDPDMHTPRTEKGESAADFHTPKGMWGTRGSNQESNSLHNTHETPKENHAQSSSFHLQRWEKPKHVESHKRENLLQNVWCETPKVTKKDASLRRRLLLSKSASDGKTGDSKVLRYRDPCTQGYVDSVSFDSPDMSPAGPFSYSTLKTEAIALSCRKRRLMFAQLLTSTLEDVKSGVASPVLRHEGSSSEPDLNESIISGLFGSDLPETPQSGNFVSSAKENFQTPINCLAANFSESLSVLSTPSCTPISKLEASASEDSGFSSLGLDKSQDSFIDEGSFQDVLPPWASRNRDKRRSRLERQRRLSTLREGGSQSDEEHRSQNLEAQVLKDEDVFLETTPVGVAKVKLHDLSLTPALQMVHAMSCRSKRILSHQASLEELLCVSTQDGPVRTSLPLSGLIGRKMGLGQLDILLGLSKRNLCHVLAIIFKLLSPQDIYMCCQVSDAWDEIVMQDKRAWRRRKLYEREMKIALEMGSVAHGPDADTRLTLACRSALSSVQSQAKTPSSRINTPAARSTCTPLQNLTPQSSSKHQEFLQATQLTINRWTQWGNQVAKTLFNDECLKQCPRCQHPARCHIVRGEGFCSWADCLFHFCTSCLCSYHGSKDCAHLTTKRRSKKDILPGSAQSKRNVRRL